MSMLLIGLAFLFLIVVVFSFSRSSKYKEQQNNNSSPRRTPERAAAKRHDLAEERRQRRLDRTGYRPHSVPNRVQDEQGREWVHRPTASDPYAYQRQNNDGSMDIITFMILWQMLTPDTQAAVQQEHRLPDTSGDSDRSSSDPRFDDNSRSDSDDRSSGFRTGGRMEDNRHHLGSDDRHDRGEGDRSPSNHGHSHGGETGGGSDSASNGGGGDNS